MKHLLAIAAAIAVTIFIIAGIFTIAALWVNREKYDDQP